MKAHYSEFVGHCLRFYTRCSKLNFKTEADRLNYYACEDVFKNISAFDRALLTGVYSGLDTLTNNVSRVAKLHKAKPGAVWKLIHEVEEKIAVRRGLL